MLALYRCGRQAEALEVYRAARAASSTSSASSRGGAPGARAGHPPSRPGARRRRRRPTAGTRPACAHRSSSRRSSSTPSIRSSRSRRRWRSPPSASSSSPRRSRSAARSPLRPRVLRGHRERSSHGGVAARAAAFTSLTPGADLARLARSRRRSSCWWMRPTGCSRTRGSSRLLDDAPCDVAVLVGGGRRRAACSCRSPARTTTGRRSSSARGSRVHAGRRSCSRAAAVGATGRDASRLLANASLAVQRALGRRRGAAAGRADSSGPRSTPPGTRAWSSSGSPTAGGARASVAPARRSPRHRIIRRCSSGAGFVPAGSPPGRPRRASRGRSPAELELDPPRAERAGARRSGRSRRGRRRWAEDPPKVCSTPSSLRSGRVRCPALRFAGPIRSR